ncbi:hypothetical protein PHYBLDRAFT_164858 [Phycomyces blakesleeanus NRRL 1555(-)]|uniref:Uncharacterized protein n=1 Tax=Phycomyces blakesleeanus (strain ATCC 8743b / DSM 1359 / FGSC 10004 / NBRC 33097 / NRRL 1555) TaxID=763407 RepID=A0A167PI77_PHYB8|nr:hypothetical protein PHYBLDRAFT_164858 [Phycomyces blakesleeanus NRRL 1555(-)]OAD77977.1 hypothetical protein PHYBLDRAFT_164858 [Phycomyces blakesleeanus NRRL 1555(-)]|eukprot:XP_018296017.1 hypothetical protein PHYBLDRAFT_164858 [Phycomyces blakesleeanus NRRL 1555(-)]
MFFYMSKRIKSMTPSSLSPHYAAQSPSGRKPDLVAKEVLEWWQTNGKHPFIQPHISSPSNVGANSPENLPLGDKVQLIRLPVASPSAVKEFSQVSSEEPAHLTTEFRMRILKCFLKQNNLTCTLYQFLPDLNSLDCKEKKKPSYKFCKIFEALAQIHQD